jgi:hypothetical protein
MTNAARILVALVAVPLMMSPLSAKAGAPGDHPAYLHALTDLRHARAFLGARHGNPEMKWDEHTAIREIDEALREIKVASIEDGKNLNDHPPVDVHMEWRGMLHNSLDLLRKAKHDIEGEEDNAGARGLKKRALQHINVAIDLTKTAIDSAHW